MLKYKLLKISACTVLFILSLSGQANAHRSMFTGLKTIKEIDQRLAKLPESYRGRKKAVLLSDKATLLYKSGLMPESAKIFEEALIHNTTRRMRRHIYLFMGKAYESHGRVDKAISAYEEALAYDPKNWRRHRDLGGLYEKVQLYEKARSLYLSALDLYAKEPSVWYVTARVFRKMGLYVEAESYLEKAKHMGHDEHVVAREESFINEGRGRFTQALGAWYHAVGHSSDPKDGARAIYLAVLSRNFTAAKDELERLKTLKPEKDAVKLYENLIELGLSDPDSLFSFRGNYPEVEPLVSSFLADTSKP